MISRSRSTSSHTATLCTRPADSDGRTFFHSTGDSSKPTRRSSTRRACWALTRFMSTVRGFSIASKMARFVISWKTIRFVPSTGRPNTSVRCHAMASPSRSSSEASHTVRSFAARVSSSTGANPSARLIPRSFFERSRIWPKLDLTMKSLPKNFSIVLALAGDSTITKFSCIVNRLYMRKPKYRNLGSQKAMCNCRLYFISV